MLFIIVFLKRDCQRSLKYFKNQNNYTVHCTVRWWKAYPINAKFKNLFIVHVPVLMEYTHLTRFSEKLRLFASRVDAKTVFISADYVQGLQKR